MLVQFLLTLLLILSASFCKKHKKIKRVKSVKIAGKTVCHAYPRDWWPFEPTVRIQESFGDATRTIPTSTIGNQMIKTIFIDNLINSNNYYEIKPTKFVDFKKSEEYKRLWKRTHRGFHWLPPTP